MNPRIKFLRKAAGDTNFLDEIRRGKRQMNRMETAEGLDSSLQEADFMVTFDTNTQSIVASEFNDSISPLQWIKNATGEVVGFVFGSYVDGFGAGTFLVGQGNSADAHGVAQLQTLIQGQQINEFATRFYTYSSGGATLESGEDATNDAKGSQGFTIKTKISASDSGEEDTTLYLQSRNKGVTKAGWANKIVFQLQDRSGGIDDAGYIQFEAVETSANAESYRVILGVKEKGTHVETVLYEPTPYTIILLHFNDSDASITITDSMGIHAWTASGNAQIDTAQSVFGGSSLLLDGTGDFISTNDHANFTFGTDDFDNHVRLRFAALPTAGNNFCIWSQRTDANNYMRLIFRNVAGVYSVLFEAFSGGASIVSVSNTFTSPAIDTWYEFVISKVSNVYRMFIDASQIGADATDTSSLQNYANNFIIGQFNSGAYFNGWMDEFRFRKGVGLTSYTTETDEF